MSEGRSPFRPGTSADPAAGGGLGHGLGFGPGPRGLRSSSVKRGSPFRTDGIVARCVKSLACSGHPGDGAGGGEVSGPPPWLRTLSAAKAGLAGRSAGRAAMGKSLCQGGYRAILLTRPLARRLWAFLVPQCPLVAMQPTAKDSASTAFSGALSKTQLAPFRNEPRAAPRHPLSSLLLAAVGTPPPGPGLGDFPNISHPPKGQEGLHTELFWIGFCRKDNAWHFSGGDRDCRSGGSWGGAPHPPHWAGACCGRRQASLVSAPEAGPLPPPRPAGSKAGPPTPGCTSFLPHSDP